MKKNAASLFYRIEKILKTDLKYLASGTFWFTVGQVVGTLSSFLLSLAFANLLPKEIYGTYRYILSVAGLFSAFTFTGMNDALMRAIARGKEGSLGTATKERIKGGTIGALCGLILAGYYYFQGNAVLGVACLIIALFLPLFDTFSGFTAYLQGTQQFKKLNLYGILIQIISVACLIITVLLTRNIIIIELGYFVPLTLLRLAFFIKVRRQIKNRETDTGMIGYGRHLSFLNIFSDVASRLDQLLLFQMLGAVPLAIYSIALAIPNQIKGPLSNLESMITPRFARRTAGDIDTGMANKIFWLFLFHIVIIVLYIVFVPYVFRIFFPKYLASVGYSQLYALSLISGIMVPVEAFLYAHKRIKEQYISSLAYSVFQIVAVVIGIFSGGILGLIIARIASRWFGGILLYVLYRRAVKSSQSSSSA